MTLQISLPGRGVPDTLEIAGLSIRYGSAAAPLHAVRGIDLRVRPGEALGLIGESGSGKSSVAYSILRHIPGHVTAERLKLQDLDLAAMAERGLRQVRGGRIGIVYQDPMNALNPVFRVGDQVAESLQLHKGLSRSAARSRVIDLFRRVRLPDPETLLERYPHQLSGGQQQRVVIAMAIACEPELLIMDEPTTGLDVTTETVILDLVAELRRELAIAILFISHNLSVVAKICDRVAVLYAGQVVEEGPAQQILKTPRHPYTIGLLASMPPLDRRLERLASIPGGIPDLRDLPKGCIFRPRCAVATELCARMPGLEVVGAEEHIARCHYSDSVAPPQRETLERMPGGEEARPRLQITSVTKRFPVPVLARLLTGEKPITAVSGASFSIAQGKTLALVGESGSGKSTLARCIAGLGEWQEGEITFDGAPLATSVSRRTRAQQRAIQFVFQNPQSSLNAHHTVAEIISRPLHIYGGTPGLSIKAEVTELLEAVKLSARYSERYPAELSGGEKQRVCIARAFAAKPSLIICDEPTSALDISVQAAVLNELNELQTRFGTSYLFISHDLAAVRQVADRIAVMQRGVIVECEDAHRLFDAPRHPYTKDLLAASRSVSLAAI